MQTHLDSLSLDPIPCCLASLLRCPVLTAPVRGSTPTLSAVPPPTALVRVPRQLSFASPSHFRIRRDFRSKNPLSGFTPKQTKESSALAAHPHSATLTLAWISSENSTTHEECWLIFTALPSLTLGPYLMPTAHFCCPVSTAHLRHPSPTDFSQSLCPALWCVPLPISGHVEISSPNPLSGFVPKQTKGLSVWRTTYIVLHLESAYIWLMELMKL